MSRSFPEANGIYGKKGYIGILADVRCVAVSPMKRCRESAELLFPGKKQEVCEHLRECDFGQFENRNYEEHEKQTGISALVRQRQVWKHFRAASPEKDLPDAV